MPEEFTQRDLTGARFEQVDLSGAEFDHVDLTGARLRMVDVAEVEFRAVAFRHVMMRGVELQNVDINGELMDVRVNGVDIGPLVEAELDRQHPERLKLRPTTADGFREAWPVLEGLWAQTVERARHLDPALLHESVDGEWSFIETQRHLVFATDCWVRRALLGDPAPWHPLSLPWDEMPDTEGVPRDREVRPTLDEVLAMRADRMDGVRRLLADLTDERLAEDTEPVEGPGWPESRAYPVKDCLDVLINEEWWHRQFAERDLAVLESSGHGDRPG